MAAGLSRFLRERGHTIVEVNRPNRQLRYQQGKSDAVDAESAARAVLCWPGCRWMAEVGHGHGRDDPSPQDRSRHRSQGQDAGHADAQGNHLCLLSGCPARAARPGQRQDDAPLRRLVALRPGLAHFHAGVGQGEPARNRPALAAAGCRDQAARRSPGNAGRPTARPNCWKRTGWPRAPRPRCCCLSATILSASTRRQHSPSCAGPPNPGIKRQDHPAPPQPRRQSAGQCRPLSGSHHPYARSPRQTLAYVRRRTAEGKSRSEIAFTLPQTLRVAREIFGYLCPRLALVGAAEISS